MSSHFNYWPVISRFVGFTSFIRVLPHCKIFCDNDFVHTMKIANSQFLGWYGMPSMAKDHLSKRKGLVLKAVLLALIFHAILPLIMDTLMRLVFPYPYQTLRRFTQGKLIWEIPPWHERLLWGQMFSQCATILFEIMTWRWISKQKPCAWAYLAIMVVGTMFYLLGVSGTTSELLVPDKYLVCVTLFGLVVLSQTRKEFSVKSAQMAELASSILLAGAIVFISGYYFPYGIIDWAIEVPAYVDIFARSRFTSQENILVLCVICYSLVRVLVLRFRDEGVVTSTSL
jgi:hypothetical protein